MFDMCIDICHMNHTLMAKCKNTVSPLLTQRRYCSLALNHRYNPLFSLFYPVISASWFTCLLSWKHKMSCLFMWLFFHPGHKNVVVLPSDWLYSLYTCALVDNYWGGWMVWGRRGHWGGGGKYLEKTIHIIGSLCVIATRGGRLTEIRAWISNHIHYFAWHATTYPCPYLNSSYLNF